MRFIVIDGIDAAGKDTHANLIKKRYENKGEEVAIRSHPCSDNIFGEKAERALLEDGNISRAKASFFFTLDVLNSIINYYRGFDTVIFVRYLCGTAYLPDPINEGVYDLFSSVLPTSSYMFFLDVEPEEALKRIKGRDEKQMFENEEDLEKNRRRALSVVDDWHIINTSQPVEEAQREINRILQKIDRKNGKVKETEVELLESDNVSVKSKKY